MDWRLRCAHASFVALLMVLSVGGCAEQSNREEITGEVKLKGQPVEDGLIQFVPLEGQQTGDGAHIQNGKYKITKDKGLAPGKYRVCLYAGNGESGVGDASPDNPNAGRRPPKERIPPEYNTKSKVVEEVVRGGPNTFNYNIP